MAALASLLVAPVVGAKSRRKGSNGDKKGSETSEVARFNLVRPENAGMMNLVPARIALEPESGVVSSNVTHLRPSKKEPHGLTLVGGDVAALALRPGTYSVQVTTPVADQPPGYHPGGKPRAWKSAAVKVVLSKGETICLVLEPGIEGTEYDGTWSIGKAASPADCGSMTEKVQHQEGAAAAPP